MTADKRIAYGYLFNYFGGEKRNGKIVNGSSIDLNIRPYKNGKEVLFEQDNEVTINGYYLFHIFNIRFDREHQFVIERNPQMYDLFRISFGWERIEASVIGYSLDTVAGLVKDVKGMDNLPEDFRNLPVSEPLIVSEDEFRTFLSAHADGFDIPDNKHTQVLSVRFYDPPENDR